MATAPTATTNIASSNPTYALGIYFDKLVFNSLQPNLYFEQLGQIIQVPAGNYTDRFVMLDQIATASVTAIGTEGTQPAFIAETVTTGSNTPTQYGVAIEMTDLVVLTTFWDLMREFATEVGFAMARKIDATIQTTAMAGDYVLYGGGKSSRSTVAAGDAIDAILMLKGKQKLTSLAAPTFKDGYYRAIVSPNVVYDLKANTSTGQWVDMAKYAQPDKLLNGEIGMLHGIRVMESANVQSISSTITVYPTLICGNDFFRVAYWLPGKIKNYINNPEDSNLYNPLGQLGSIGAKCNMGVSRTQEARGVRLETSGNTLS